MRRTTTLTIMAIAFVGLMLASPDSGRAENPAVGAPAKTPTADEVAALQHEVDALQHEVDQLRHEHAELGSGKTPSESIRISRYRIHEILVQVDRLEKVLEEKAGSMQELQRLRDQMEDTSIVTAEDLAKEAAKKAAAKGLKQVVSAAVGKAIGWVGVAAKVVTYGGRWVIQELNVSSIEEMLRNEQITINDVNKLQSALLNERNHEQRKLDRLKALREQLDDKDTKRIVKKHELEQAQARARGADIIDFGMGNPDMPTPAHITAKLMETVLVES